jgi:hypothetical protein
MMAGMGQGGEQSPEWKELEAAMKGYHDYVEHGRREIYKIEG